MFKYKIVYDEIRQQIENGLLAPNTTLPSEAELSSRYGVDRSTIRKALKMLSEEQLVEKNAGKETVVLGSRPEKPRLQASSKTKKIGFLLPPGYTIHEMFYSNLFCDIEQQLQVRDCTLIYSTLENNLMSIISTLGLDGVILVSNYNETYIKDAINANIPCVLVNNENASVPSVLSDNEKGAYLAGRHLIDKGHKDILVLSGLSSAIPNQRRIAGFRRALSESGITLKSENIILAESWEIDAGVKAFLKYMDIHPNTHATAVFGLNDRLAFGAMKALHQMGKIVPEDFSVIGYDNLNNMTLSVVKMTTIEAHVEIIAEAAVSLLLWQMNGGHCLPLKVYAPVELIEGESVKRI